MRWVAIESKTSIIGDGSVQRMVVEVSFRQLIDWHVEFDFLQVGSSRCCDCDDRATGGALCEFGDRVGFLWEKILVFILC